MLIKAGVDISRLRPEVRRELKNIAGLLWNCNEGEMVITSTYEGTHSESSLHYANAAIDIGVKKGSNRGYVAIKQWLGKNYGVVLEADHIHIEYDPK